MVSSDKLHEVFWKNGEKTAGGIMKPRRLTIIFFSIMMLAVTPRVMSHFNNYADALNQRVEAEWLNFLLGFTTPADVEKSAGVPQDSHQAAVCTKGSSKDANPATVKSRGETKATPSSPVTKKRSFEYTLTNLLSASTKSSSESSPNGLLNDRKVHGRVVHAAGFPLVPVAVNDSERAKAEHFWTLTQSALNGKGKAARALIRELSSLRSTKTLSAQALPVSFEKGIDQPSESDADAADQETSSGQVTSDESMR